MKLMPLYLFIFTMTAILSAMYVIERNATNRRDPTLKGCRFLVFGQVLAVHEYTSTEYSIILFFTVSVLGE